MSLLQTVEEEEKLFKQYREKSKESRGMKKKFCKNSVRSTRYSEQKSTPYLLDSFSGHQDDSWADKMHLDLTY